MKRNIINVDKKLDGKMTIGGHKKQMDQNEVKDVNVDFHCSDSVYTGIQSAVSFLYRKCDIH